MAVRDLRRGDVAQVLVQKPRIEPLVAVRRGDGAAEDFQPGNVRLHSGFAEGVIGRMVEVAPPRGINRSSQHQPRFLIGFAHGGQRNRPRAARAHRGFQHALSPRRQIPRESRKAVRAVHAPAREHIHAGHEVVARAAAAHEDARGLALADGQHECGGELGPHGAGELFARRALRRGEVEVGDGRGFHRRGHACALAHALQALNPPKCPLVLSLPPAQATAAWAPNKSEPGGTL